MCNTLSSTQIKLGACDLTIGKAEEAGYANSIKDAQLWTRRHGVKQIESLYELRERWTLVYATVRRRVKGQLICGGSCGQLVVWLDKLEVYLG